MRILIVEDDAKKAEAVRLVVLDAAGGSDRVTAVVADSLGAGARSLALAEFDLVVLDLMLPYVAKGQATSAAGLELLKLLRSQEGLNARARVVGLSAFPDEVMSSRALFESYGVLILSYDSSEAWQEGLTRVMADIGVDDTRISVDFVCLCSLEEERRGFDRLVALSSRAVVKGLDVEFVQTLGGRVRRGALVRLSRMGLITAAVETTRMLASFQTDIVFMSGICAGIANNVELGQVVIGSPVWEYQAGKWSSHGFEIEPYQVDLGPETRTSIDHILGEPELIGALEEGMPYDMSRPVRRTRPTLAPFASGSAVVADEAKLAHIIAQHRKIAAIDMEAYGFQYSASNNHPAPKHVFVVKVVVDLADSHKGDDLHGYGSFVSAQAGLRIVNALLDARGPGSSS